MQRVTFKVDNLRIEGNSRDGITHRTVDGVSLDVQTIEPLTPQEVIVLRQLEAQIKLNLKAFLIVADALVQIRDSRLYRAGYANFEDYLDKRWDMSRSRAYQLISSAAVVYNLSTSGEIKNEWAARQLADLKPDEQQFVFAVAKAKSEGAVTAKVIKSIRSQLIEAKVTGGFLDLGDGKPIALDAAITQDAYENMQRQKQHIADNSSWDRIDTIECTVSEAAERLEQILAPLASGVTIKLSVYTKKP